MSISRFFGVTNREAMRQVRLALGADALILSNKRVNGGVEILAADPSYVPEVKGNSPSKTIDNNQQQSREQYSLNQNNPSQKNPSSSSDMDPNQIMQEMGQMRGAIESRIDELMWGNQLKQSSSAPLLFQSLLGCGFSTALLRALLRHLPSDLSIWAAQEWVSEELTKNLPVLDSEDALWKPGLTLALVGPTGVGKTTTIAKLAARAVKRCGADNVALLTTDTYRIGAYEQLKIYGEKLRVLTRIIKNTEDLLRVMSLIPDHVTVLIDNMGVSQRDQAVKAQTSMLSRINRDVTSLLVLNASSHGSTLDEVARSYSDDGKYKLQGCIITKADEASSLGAALDTAIRYRLPVHYVSNGQQVPEHLLYLSAGALVERAMTDINDSKALYAPSQADMAVLMSNADDGSQGSNSTSQHDKSSVEALLTTLLGPNQSFSFEEQQKTLSEASKLIEDELVSAQAWDLWSNLGGNAPINGQLIGKYIDNALRSVRISGNARADNPSLVIHDSADINSASGSKANLRAALLFDSSGNSLCCAASQVSLNNGWWSSCGDSQLRVPSASQSILSQITKLHTDKPDWSLIHTFDQGSNAMVKQLTELNINWMWRVGAVTRFVIDSGRITASALSKTLQHKPVEIEQVYVGADKGIQQPVSVWFASCPVRLVGEADNDKLLRYISVKVSNLEDGKIIRHLYAVVNVSEVFAKNHEHLNQRLALYLLNAFEAKSVFRGAARNLNTSNNASGLQLLSKGLLSLQTSLAAWQLVRAPSQLSKAVDMLAGKPNANLEQLNPALIKLFALKKWLN